MILLCLVLPDSVVQPMRNKTLSVLGPLLTIGAKPVQYISRMDGKLKTLDEARSKSPSSAPRSPNSPSATSSSPTRPPKTPRLREMIGFRQASQYHLRACRVISREPSSWWTTVQVDVGWQDEPGLAKDQPVVSPRGVVGKTGTVSQYVTDVHPHRRRELQHLR